MSTTATNIFIGVWQNHNDGTWPTWTLTLKQRDGGVLSALFSLSALQQRRHGTLSN